MQHAKWSRLVHHTDVQFVAERYRTLKTTKMVTFTKCEPGRPDGVSQLPPIDRACRAASNFNLFSSLLSEFTSPVLLILPRAVQLPRLSATSFYRVAALPSGLSYQFWVQLRLSSNKVFYVFNLRKLRTCSSISLRFINRRARGSQLRWILL